MAQHRTDRSANNDPQPHLDDHNVILAPVHNMLEAGVLAAGEGQVLRKRGVVFAAENLPAFAVEGMEVPTGAELIVRNRGTGAYPGIIRFETKSSGGATEPPWILEVANAGAQGYDHVLHHLFNLKWKDEPGGWERLVDGSHCVRFGFESSFRDYETDPTAIKGTFEWNLDIDPSLTGRAFTVQKRPWNLTYDLDKLRCHLQLGDPSDRGRNIFQCYGSMSDVTSLSLKSETDVSFFQVSRGKPGRTILVSENGPMDVNVDNSEEVRIGNHSTTGGAIWLNSVVEARNEVRFLRFPVWNNAALVQNSVGAAGRASPLPAKPSKYLQVKDDSGKVLVIPAYAAS